MRVYSTYDSIIGELFIVAESQKISAIYIGEQDFLKKENESLLTLSTDDSLLSMCTQQLDEYFQGERQKFTLPSEIIGTNFQEKVWAELCEIPLGTTKSYQDIANNIGSPKAVRAIGQANKANKLPIIIPCHRVIGKNSSLTGYAGNRTDIKQILLEHEGAHFNKK